MSHILGIDLGTTNSCAAIYENGKEKIIINTEGGRTTPSVVSFSNNEFQVGEVAKNAALLDPQSAIVSVKRSMGYNKNFELGGQKLTPQTVSGLILEKIKHDAEIYLGETIRDAVITVPAYFNDQQRQATIDAGRMAGLNVVRILNEPSAAALAYGITTAKGIKNVLVFDFGGGTLDVSIVKVSPSEVSVISTSGINDLGGDDIDNAIAENIISDFYLKEKYNLKKDPKAVARIRKEAEAAKKALTTSSSYKLSIPYIVNIDGEEKHIEDTFTRERFENIISTVLANIDKPIKTAIEDAGLSTDDIDEVLLVGGSTRIPFVQKKIKDIIGLEPKKLINPDEAVAIGAAIQANIIAGNTEIRFSDITSLSLSVRTASDLVKVLIPRNTKIPVKKTHTFQTSYDNQSDVIIEVFQGERKFYYDNKKIGHFILDGITPAPKGCTSIDVTFSVDENGVLSVSASETTSGKTNEITVTDYLKLSEKEIEEAIRIAEYFKTQDSDKKTIVIEKKNCEYIISLLDELENSSLDFTTDELEKFDDYRAREEEFLHDENVSLEDVETIVKDNLVIKAFIFDLQKRLIDSESE